MGDASRSFGQRSDRDELLEPVDTEVKVDPVDEIQPIIEPSVEEPAVTVEEVPMTAFLKLTSQSAWVYRDATAQDFIAGKVHWTSSWKNDAIFHLCNENMLLSLFFVHRNHPFRKQMRWIVQFCSLAMAFLLTAVGARLPWEYVSSVWELVAAPIILFFWNFYINTLATCKCIYQQWIPGRLRTAAATVIRYLIIIDFLTSVGCAVVGVSLLYGALEEDPELRWLRIWATTQISSFLWSIPIDLLLFAVYRYWQTPTASSV